MANFHVEAGQVLLVPGPAKVDLVSDDNPVITNGVTPTVTSLEPDTAVAGDAEDIEMVVTGTGFNELSKIVFGGNDEPTTLLSPTQVRTIVKPSVFPSPDDVPVEVRNGALISDEMAFSFTAAAGTQAAAHHHAHRARHPTRRKRG